MDPTRTASIRRRLWPLVVLVLLALRAPSIAQPAGNDQSLYMYVADRVRAGAVPYLDTFDQKPPGIAVVYAGLRAVWPHPSIVAIADLAAAALVAWLLIWIGRRVASAGVGYAAASLFLLFGHPSLERVSGVYVRGQCETFISAAIAGGLVLVLSGSRVRSRLFLAGLCLAAAFWLKYNALAYALPVLLALGLRRTESGAFDRRAFVVDVLAVTAGFVIVLPLVLGYFAVHGALGDLWLDTITYNLAYSRETYNAHTGNPLTYLATMPVAHAKTSMLWFLGCAGALVLVLVGLRRKTAAALLALGWLAAAFVSIAVNGARELPQYFVQAGPPLAFAAALAARLAWREGLVWRAAIVVVAALGLWKVGVETSTIAGLRWGGLPQLAENIRLDIGALTGRISHADYLAHFTGGDGHKYDAAAFEDLASHIRGTTRPDDRILVFGFAPSVYLDSGRLSSTRFFWSRAVIMEFAADQPGYGSKGLLGDLEAHPPAIVALQKRDWFPDVANSIDFFMSTPALRDWLAASYALDSDSPVFSVWRRRP